MYWAIPKRVGLDATLTDSTVPETETEWDVEATYADGDAVFKTVNGIHLRYDSAQAANTGHDPEDDDGTWWTARDATNRYAMFDGKLQTQTTAEDEIEVTLSPNGRIDTLALMNVDAKTIRVRMYDRHDALLIDQTFGMTSPSGILSLFKYFFNPVVRKRDLILRGKLRLHANPKIVVTISSPGETVGVGGLLMSFATYIGGTKWGARPGFTDYSVKGKDDFGNFVVVERAYSKGGSFDVIVEPGFVDELLNMAAKYRATPMLLIGDDDYASTAIYGIIKDASVVIAYDIQSLCSVDFEGLT